jgi:hypothetical protein
MLELADKKGIKFSELTGAEKESLWSETKKLMETS